MAGKRLKMFFFLQRSFKGIDEHERIYGLFEISKYSDAAALVMLMVGVMLVVIAIINALVSLILRPRARKFN